MVQHVAEMIRLKDNVNVGGGRALVHKIDFYSWDHIQVIMNTEKRNRAKRKRKKPKKKRKQNKPNRTNFTIVRIEEFYSLRLRSSFRIRQICHEIMPLARVVMVGVGGSWSGEEGRRLEGNHYRHRHRHRPIAQIESLKHFDRK